MRLGLGAVGALLGALVGVLWALFGWHLFLILFLALIGFGVGKLLESEELRDRIRELFSSLYR